MKLDVKIGKVVNYFGTGFGEIHEVPPKGDYDVNTYILVDEDGNELPAVVVDEEILFDATPNDIRLGKVAATGTGVTIGEKVIPSYYTTEAVKVIPAGSDYIVKLPTYSLYDYTKFQGIICPFNTSLSDSVSADKVVINDHLYEVKSTVSIATITVDSETQTINLGISNVGDSPCIIRFFTYKEIY